MVEKVIMLNHSIDRLVVVAWNWTMMIHGTLGHIETRKENEARTVVVVAVKKKTERKGLNQEVN